ncbi:MAG TPA: methyl-accepting chemotaxis protein [Pseudomonadota bacterium]|nr:methyl-accepting chemotaxis protein [Pseudomonadota bacterium]
MTALWLSRLLPHRRIVLGAVFTVVALATTWLLVLQDNKVRDALRKSTGPHGQKNTGLVFGLGTVFLLAGAGFWVSHHMFCALETQQKQRERESFSGLFPKLEALSLHLSRTLAEVEDMGRVAIETAQSAEQQTQHVADAASTLGELTLSTTDIAQGAAEAARIASDTKEAAVKGAQLAESASNQVQQVAEFAHELNRTVDRLSRRVGEIGEITTLVKDIADQTKLLALNASIEAARDSGHATGFSVVAAEVRRLADLTVRETGQISARIRSVQEETEHTNLSMQKTTRQIEDILGNVKHVLVTLTSIVDISGVSKEQIALLAEAVEQQSRAMNRISLTMEQSSQISANILQRVGNVNPKIETMRSGLLQMQSDMQSVVRELPKHPTSKEGKG